MFKKFQDDKNPKKSFMEVQKENMQKLKYCEPYENVMKRTKQLEKHLKSLKVAPKD